MAIPTMIGLAYQMMILNNQPIKDLRVMKFFLYAYILENRKIVINIINRISRRYYRSICKFMEPPDRYLERPPR